MKEIPDDYNFQEIVAIEKKRVIIPVFLRRIYEKRNEVSMSRLWGEIDRSGRGFKHFRIYESSDFLREEGKDCTLIVSDEGRLRLPNYVVDDLRLENSAFIMGNDAHIEIWKPETYARFEESVDYRELGRRVLG